MNHKKRSLLRPSMSRYEQYIFLFNSHWIGALEGLTRRHRRMLQSLKSLLMTAQSMRGHAKGRELRRRAFERLKKLDPETRIRFEIALGIKDPSAYRSRDR